MHIGIGLGLTSRRGGGAAYSIVNGDGVSGTASIVSAGGDEWTVTSTGSPSGPWTVTTAQLALGKPILLEPQTVTTAAGPIYIVEVGDEPLFLCPTGDLSENTYEWKRSGSTVGTGRTYDATADTGLLIESVITAFNGASGGVTGVESVVVAQAAATEVLPVQFSNQKLTNATTVAAGGSRLVVVTFETPAVLGSQYLWQGGTGFNTPAIFFDAAGALTVNIGVGVISAAGLLAPSTKYTVFACHGPTRRQVFLQQGATITTVVNNTAITTAVAIAKTTVGIRDTGTIQFTGRMWRIFSASEDMDFSNATNRQYFTDAAGAVVLPTVAESAVPTFDFNLYDRARMEAGTNAGVFGPFTKSGSAFP